MPLTGSIAAVSVGMVDGRALCDLDYVEDSTAEVDANVVMTGDGGLVEVQATAERTPLSRASLDELLALAEGGIARLREVQERVSIDPRHRQPPQAGGDGANCCRGSSCSRCPRASRCRRRRRQLRGQRADQGPRRPRGDRRGGDRRRLRDRGRGPRRRARASTPPATPASASATRSTSPSCCAKSTPPAASRRAAYVCVLALIDADGDRAPLRSALRGPAAGRAPRLGRLRLRPGLRPRRHRPRRRAHDGRAERRREERDQPPRPRRADAGRAPRPRPRAPR